MIATSQLGEMVVAEQHDLYEIVGVPADASREDVVRAYRRQAHRLHPDAHPADPTAAERFRQLTAAYEVLADPSRRRSYDQRRCVDSPSRSEVSARRTAAPTSVRVAGTGPATILAIGPVHVELPSDGQAPSPLSADQAVTVLAAGPILFIERRWP
jgi:curved DNA-binding protein CbpA